jgi:hypothetical protein
MNITEQYRLMPGGRAKGLAKSLRGAKRRGNPAQRHGDLTNIRLPVGLLRCARKDHAVAFGFLIMLALLAMGASPGPAAAGTTLYEYYTNVSREELAAGTKDMGRELRTMFDQQSVAARQEDIDFAEYVANLKKIIYYGGKLATYGDYEEDLSFARAKEIFKGLPEEKEATDNNKRKTFVQTKYTAMKGNVEEEIATYHGMILLALDVCQSTMAHDVSDLRNNDKFQDAIAELANGKEYLHFQRVKTGLQKMWPELVARIEQQLDYWPVNQAPAADDPILDPLVVGAIQQ